jgi:tetratricopeptide (TPR) repeat protein
VAQLSTLGHIRTMNEDDYISELRASWPREGDASIAVVALVDEAVRAFPLSARLWVMRGDLIQLGSDLCPHPLEEALRSFQRAVELDPQFAEGWDELGHYYDAVLNDEKTAQEYFEKAKRLRYDHVA